MFFLLRVVFWLSLVVILLPSDPASQKDSAHKQVSTFEAIGAAQTAVVDARGFCARNPDACEIGADALHTFGQKAQYSSKMLYEFLSNHLGDSRMSRKADGEVNSAERPGRHTLTPPDATPDWKAPEPRTVPLPPRRPA
jgi:hypothetical protein